MPSAPKEMPTSKRREPSLLTPDGRAAAWRRFRRKAFLLGVPRLWPRRMPLRFLVLWTLILGAAGLLVWYGLVLVRAANDPGALTAQQQAATQGVLVAGGALLALVLAVWRSLTAKRQTDIANRQAKTASQQAAAAEYGRRTDRFTTGVNMLANESLLVRIGGLNLLAQLARDDPERFGLAVCETIISFVQYPPHNTKEQPVVSTKLQELDSKFDTYQNHLIEVASSQLRGDVNEAVIRLSELGAIVRKASGQHRNYVPKISNSDISGLKLSRRELSWLSFNKVSMQGASLASANLQNTSWVECDLTGANFESSNLTESRFLACCFKHTVLDYCLFQNANLHVTGDSFALYDACLASALISTSTKAHADLMAGQGWTWSDMPAVFSVQGRTNSAKTRIFPSESRPADWPKPPFAGAGYRPPQKP